MSVKFIFVKINWNLHLDSNTYQLEIAWTDFQLNPKCDIWMNFVREKEHLHCYSLINTNTGKMWDLLTMEPIFQIYLIYWINTIRYILFK